ncbi:hypothetical protein [Wenzhouxiangella marina]|uniref:Uncharacterized protein n=1 Tax=Wenzhouxiangella marina TaxID=1579979 RepID=A0A0K0XUK6_9GAMM|nr:hypothetical protein [Wenzhouxiangella marina]AKS41301.1 hypothetical protein WM2015_920 [Wenzhouxiangella marina]MBB6086949.1 hypothetical protein [Wenzhouxiangella marina]
MNLRSARLAALGLLALLALAACSSNSQQRERDDAIMRWESTLRWSEQYDGLLDFIHPEWLAEHPISTLDIDRLGQFRVTEYRVRQVIASPDGLGLDRRVQLRLYHVHTSRERVIDHREVWRYDEERERWLLHSGIPDPRRH